MDAVKLAQFNTLSPFEIKDYLIGLAHQAADKSAVAFLNAGRGNPNWVATHPRDAFFLLGQFAMSESRRVQNILPGLGGMPKMDGIAQRLETWLATRQDQCGADFLTALLPWSIDKFGFKADAFVHELVDSIIGDNYPVPDRILAHNEQITHEYLMWVMGPRPAGKFSLFAVEGGTAAMCYLYKALKNNRLVNPGDSIAIGVPIFTPYIEMTQLEDYDLNMVEIFSRQEDKFQYTEKELEKLLDPKIKAFCLVNPGNPTSMALSAETIGHIKEILKKRPDLIIVTDDVYGSFVPGFHSLLGECPRNTIGVYSFSKYFGATGWRLGVIAVHEDNVMDTLIASHPEATQKILDNRYRTLALEPRSIRFIDRVVADSRDVALNHTSGLSLPQQVMMMLFSLSELMDAEKKYQAACIEIVRKRVRATAAGLGVEVPGNALYDSYYGLIDLEFWMRKYVGDEFVQWMKANVHPLDIVFRLAEDHGIVLLNGGGFDAPDWSARVSFANLEDQVYTDIGRAVRAVARGYLHAFEVSKGVSVK
jgi:aspartate 4-decarboxylase